MTRLSEADLETILAHNPDLGAPAGLGKVRQIVGATSWAGHDAPPAKQTLVLPYPPSANRYWRTYQGRTVVSDDARTYKAAVGLQCGALGLFPAKGDVRLRLDYYRPAKRGDLDNRLKVLLDALQGHIYSDDGQVAELHVYRHEDARNPRVEIEVVSLEHGD